MKEDIAALAADAHDKRIRYLALGTMNTPTDPVERKKATVEYALARAEYFKAELLLADATKAV